MCMHCTYCAQRGHGMGDTVFDAGFAIFSFLHMYISTRA